MPLDADIDSDNDGILAGSIDEENMEDIPGDITKPGKLTGINDNDNDADGILDFADGYSYEGTAADAQCAGEQFIPIELELDSSINVNTAKIKVEYCNDSVALPESINKTGVAPRFTYALTGNGKLRLWTKNGGTARNKASVNSQGDFIPNNESIDLSKFTFIEGTRRVPWTAKNTSAGFTGLIYRKED
ncbi:MAG: hypothetical protein PHT33_09390 [bacterium]|nr:hypothetical protein [bacterium]